MKLGSNRIPVVSQMLTYYVCKDYVQKAETLWALKVTLKWALKVTCFDEAFNEISKEGQKDIIIRLWDSSMNKECCRCHLWVIQLQKTS